MTYVRTFVSIAVLTSAALTASAWAATGDQTDSLQLARDTVAQVAQAQSGNPRTGMRAGTTAPDYASQMKAMQRMHDEMLAAKTPEERSALMAKQMKLMQSGMNMMSSMGGMSMMGSGMGMGADAATGKPADMAARQAMMEQRMDMMQSMMQMMTDRLQTVPATK
ncbi:hypothetical protein ABS755_14265 [Castellaniella sp. FW104-16D08]|uniref:hypothetical protein n=1 Tax=unclassified Castellaniella TaxID=2617606 RepID=UPI0033152774